MSYSRVFYNMVNQGHNWGTLSWGVLVVSATCPVFSNNKLKEDQKHLEKNTSNKDSLQSLPKEFVVKVKFEKHFHNGRFIKQGIQ